jgi:hypothetical protein
MSKMLSYVGLSHWYDEHNVGRLDHDSDLEESILKATHDDVRLGIELRNASSLERISSGNYLELKRVEMACNLYQRLLDWMDDKEGEWSGLQKIDALACSSLRHVMLDTARLALTIEGYPSLVFGYICLEHVYQFDLYRHAFSDKMRSRLESAFKKMKKP